MKKLFRLAIVITLCMAVVSVNADCVDLWAEYGECRADPDCRLSDMEAIVGDLLGNHCFPVL